MEVSALVYFCNIENFVYGEINKRSFSNLHLWCISVRIIYCTYILALWQTPMGLWNLRPLKMRLTGTSADVLATGPYWMPWSRLLLIGQMAWLWILRCVVSQHLHDDVIKWKHYWSFVRGIHRSPVNSPHKGQWRGALMFSLICDWINGWVNNREAGDLRRHRAHHDVIVLG